MSVMRSIVWNVYKDLYLMRRTVLFYSALILVFAALFVGNQFTPVFAVLLASVVMVPSWLTYLEERNRGLTFQRSLPIPVSAIVGAKYVDMLLVAGWMYAMAIAAALWRLQSASPGEPAGPMAWALGATTAVMLVPAGLSLWAFFKWGYQAVRHAFLVFWVLFMAVLWPFTSLLRASGDPDAPSLIRKAGEAVRLASESMARRAHESPGLSMAVVVAVTLGLYSLSAVAACRAFRRREV